MASIFSAYAEDKATGIDKLKTANNTTQPDSVKLQIADNNAYYQKVVIVDSNITESMIYIRSLQFMASTNFQQTYGYEEEGKLIFTTTQDLNINPVYKDSYDEDPEPYTTQFTITLDIKNGRYRYTIHHVIFYLPTNNGNARQTLYDIYRKENGDESRRVQKDAHKLIASFERYINTITANLYAGIEHKSAMYNSKF